MHFDFGTTIIKIEVVVFFFVMALGLLVGSIAGIRRRGLKSVIEGTVSLSMDDEESQVKKIKKTRLSIMTKMQRNAEAAGVHISERELLSLTLAAGAVFFIIGYVISRSLYTSIPLMVLALFVPRFLINRRKKRRLKMIEVQLVDFLTKAASMLEAGRTLKQAIAILSKDFPAPLGDELRFANNELSVGIEAQKAIQNIGDRIQSKDVLFMAQSTQITEKAGGSLDVIFRGVANEVRQRKTFRERVKTLTTQQRVSGYFLGGIGPIVVAGIQLIDPSYLATFFHSAFGVAGLVYAVVSVTFGLYLIRRMMNVEE